MTTRNEIVAAQQQGRQQGRADAFLEINGVLSSVVEELFKAQRIFRLPKVEAQAWALGQNVYWNEGQASTSVSGPLIGAAGAAAADPSKYGYVALADPIPRTTLTDITTPNATDEASAVTLANATKTKVNALLAALRGG